MYRKNTFKGFTKLLKSDVQTIINFIKAHYPPAAVKEAKLRDYPFIENIVYLKGYELLISFSNGEDRAIDMTNSLNIPATRKYASPSVFHQFNFDKYAIWRGDRDSSYSWEIGHDSLYRLSKPM
jgi:hypothetical protein